MARFEEFDDLAPPRELDSRGRVPGAVACEVDEALEYVRELALEYGE